MMTQKEKAILASKARYIYLFREIKTQKVLYVGCTKYLGRRLHEHRTAINNPKNYTAIYMYMREHNLKFFEDVEIVIVQHVFGQEEAQKVEAEYIAKYKDTVLNEIKWDTRKYNTDPRIRKVIDKTTGKIYWCVKEAFEDIGTTRYLLDRAIKKQEPIDGRLFDYYN